MFGNPHSGLSGKVAFKRTMDDLNWLLKASFVRFRGQGLGFKVYRLGFPKP